MSSSQGGTKCILDKTLTPRKELKNLMQSPTKADRNPREIILGIWNILLRLLCYEYY
jgi:hypothetical protein